METKKVVIDLSSNSKRKDFEKKTKNIIDSHISSYKGDFNLELILQEVASKPELSKFYAVSIANEIRHYSAEIANLTIVSITNQYEENE